MTTERERLLARFLDRAGWGSARRATLAGDASFRRYDRLINGNEHAVLMDAPPPMEDVRPFLKIARILLAQGFSAPRILAEDVEQGFLLLEDLGDDLYSRVIRAGGDEEELYRAAIEALAALHRCPAPADVAPYDMDRLLMEAELVTEWFMPARFGAPVDAALKAEYRDLWRQLLAPVLTAPPVLVLRDYHADNLIWLPRREGIARVGQLDFQDALIGAPAYDLVSLLEDARRDVAPALAARMIDHYIACSGCNGTGLRRDYALLGAQRNAKIVGIFTRLWKRDSKPSYLALLPRVWRLLDSDLARPELAPMRAWFDRNIPAAARSAPLPGAPAVNAA